MNRAFFFWKKSYMLIYKYFYNLKDYLLRFYYYKLIQYNQFLFYLIKKTLCAIKTESNCIVFLWKKSSLHQSKLYFFFIQHFF